jgi:alkanesulfonate monooxygenase SsuD/methylene tetrahydromethanopterin reductase-like flavin-dependent oxidoreductase (luciferase family)
MEAMKVRIGVSLGPAGTPDRFAAAVDLLEQAGVDSLWLPEMVYSPLVEPFTGLAFRCPAPGGSRRAPGSRCCPAGIRCWWPNSSDPLLASIRQRRPQADPGTLVAAGWDGARRMIEQYVRAGLSKFVVRPAAPPASFGSFVADFVRQLTPLQS